jgi:hypothetical protein
LSTTNILNPHGKSGSLAIISKKKHHSCSIASKEVAKGFMTRSPNSTIVACAKTQFVKAVLLYQAEYSFTYKVK